MPRIPKRLFGPIQVATGPTTVYTVPALTKTILRYLRINNPSAAAVTLTISIGADAAASRIMDAYSIPAKAAGVTDSARDLFVYLPMEAGEILTLSAGANNVLTIAVGGDECVLG